MEKISNALKMPLRIVLVLVNENEEKIGVTLSTIHSNLKKLSLKYYKR